MRRILRGCMVAWASVCFSFAQGDQDLDVKLRYPVKQYTLSADSFPQALDKVASDFEIPMGIEWLHDRRPPATVSLSVAETTVRGVIRSLVATHAGCDYQIENGVVHVFDRTVGPDRRNFLNLKIPSLTVEDQFLAFANVTLRMLVQKTVAPRPPTPGAGEAWSISSGLGDRRVSVRLENATVRQILDNFLHLAGFKVWVVTFAEPLSPTPSGFFRTTSLSNPRVFPDSEQPVWDLLVWDRELRSADSDTK